MKYIINLNSKILGVNKNEKKGYIFVKFHQGVTLRLPNLKLNINC